MRSMRRFSFKMGIKLAGPFLMGYLTQSLYMYRCNSNHHHNQIHVVYQRCFVHQNVGLSFISVLHIILYNNIQTWILDPLETHIFK